MKKKLFEENNDEAMLKNIKEAIQNKHPRIQTDQN